MSESVKPAAWVLVPREPTEAMIEAMSREWFSIGATGWHSTYAAMIATSPSPSGDVREAVARIVDPAAFDWPTKERGWTWGNEDWDEWQAKMERCRQEALSKADQIAALYVERIGVGVSQSQPCTDGTLPVLKEPQHSGGWRDLNLNDYVWIRPTRLGLDILRQNHEAVFALVPGSYPFQPPTPDADGWVRMQAWVVMQEFGQHLANGRPVPFETTIRIATPASPALSGSQRSEIALSAPDEPQPPPNTRREPR